VLAEFGLTLPAEVDVRVEDSNQKCRFIVMPVRPAGTEGWTEDQLTEIVTRDCLIGVALPKPGVTSNIEAAACITRQAGASLRGGAIMPVPEKMHAPADMAECAANWTPVPLAGGNQGARAGLGRSRRAVRRHQSGSSLEDKSRRDV
jgi:hypothetical protein